MSNKPLPHPPYSDEYVLPKTKYGIPVQPEQFQDNKFEYQGRDAEDNGTRWWEVQWAKDEERARQEKGKREAGGKENLVERNQGYFTTTTGELNAFACFQKPREYEKEKRAAKKAGADRNATEKQREEDCKAIREAEMSRLVELQTGTQARGEESSWWTRLFPN